ncbi:MAG: Zn-dependent exopeptidase M28 [Myxococcales bacterium]|nr:Zn-dependent exopeptidase M28 [Myxococcales bacterium]
MLRRAVLTLPLLVACGDAPGAIEVDASSPPSPDAAPDAAAGACAPLGECAWLDDYQRRIVGALSGAEDIAPGLRLAHRASVAERDATRVFLFDELTALGLVPRRHDYTTVQHTGANVLATLDATGGAGGTIIVGAHFDSVPAGPGAADNATGVAMVLAAARYLKDVPQRNHQIVFAFFDQEELGLIGSKQYVRTLAGTDVMGAHVFDMLSFDGDGDRAVELWSPTPALQTVYQTHGAAAGMPVSSVMFQYSDHQAFLDAGFPATGVGEEFVANDHTPHYHKATDTFANVSFQHLSRVSHLMLAVLDAEVRTP